MNERGLVKLGTVVKEFSVRNKKMESTAVFSVTNSAGFTPSSEYFNKEVFSKDLSNYKIVKRGMFAYNPSRINVGSVDYLRNEELVVVSPLYVIFQVDEKRVDSQYLYHYLRSEIGLNQIRNHTAGSVRDSLSFSALSEIEINLPSLNEQCLAAQKLDLLGAAIVLCNRILEKSDELVKSRKVGEMPSIIGEVAA